ncbi:protein kinase domain-containing protein [Streptomyces sp. 6N223]|uniref:protein kinase domain-containing protein n=1 Tax=Streptomyces sp. 6N223 TaxID=3457412 RepID=UPI003FD297CC
MHGSGASAAQLRQFQPLEADDPPVVGRYPLAARLGAGGMGRVYLAYTPGGRPVAIKVVRPELGEDPQFRARFQREVRAAERVQGLYTAPVVDSDTEGPVPWLATAYIPGPSLADAVSRHGPLPLPTVMLLLAGTAEALQAIHGAGLVHRDLKPSNVLLAADGPRVIDFGIARAAESGTALTGSGMVVGTPSFMSPEQAAGAAVGPATDVFALGQLAVYAASGTPAFGEGTSHAVLYRIVHEWPDLSALPGGPLKELAAHCLAKDPAARPGPPEVIARCRAALPAGAMPAPGQWLPAAVAAELAVGAPPRPPRTATAATQPTGHTRRRRPSATRRRGVVMAGAAAVAALAVGAGVVLLSGDGGEDGAGEAASSPGSGDASAESPRRSESPPGGTEPEAPTLPDAPDAAEYPGLAIPAGYHLYLGEDPVEPRASGAWNMAQIDFRYFTGEDPALLRTAEGNTLVLLEAGEEGSFAACAADDAQAVASVSMDRVEEGSQVCVRTAAGHVALITVTGLPGAEDTLTVDATVWRDARAGLGNANES